MRSPPLFDFNLLETEKRVEEICNEACRWRDTDNRKAEQILRKGLQQYPGNDILLNNLLYTMRSPARAQEVIDLCRVLIEGAKHEDVRYDAMRILAETYKEQGEYALCKAAIAQIPEIYFSKQQLDALLLEGEDMFGAAWGQKHVAAQDLLHMFLRLSDYYQSKGQLNQAKSQLTMLIAIGDTLQSDLEDQNGYYPRCYREITEKRSFPSFKCVFALPAKPYKKPQHSLALCWGSSLSTESTQKIARFYTHSNKGSCFQSESALNFRTYFF